MVCFDNGPGLVPGTHGNSAGLISGRKVTHHLSTRMIANTLLSVGIPRAGFARGRRGGVGSGQDSHRFSGPCAPGLRASETLHYLPPRLGAVLWIYVITANAS